MIFNKLYYKIINYINKIIIKIKNKLNIIYF